MQNSLQSELTVDDLLKGDLQLTSPPVIYFELQKVIENPSKSFADAAFIIEKDAALALKLMKIVNSAFYGFPSSITSVTKAITIIGVRELQSLVLGAVIIDRFSNLPGNIISMQDFWARSVKCALIAKELDANLGSKYRDAVFLSGLVHDIGQLVFFRRLPELAREVELRLQSKRDKTSSDEIMVEEDIIGFDHYQTGAALCRLWKLPEIIYESIRLHNHPDDAGSYHEIAAIARLANSYCKLEVIPDTVLVNNLGVSAGEMNQILESVSEQFDEIFRLFYHPG